MPFHRRREFSNPVKRAAYARSNGICECHLLPHVEGLIEGCGRKLSIGNIFYEHADPDRNGGKPTLENCAVLTRACWRVKTGWDRRTITRTARLEDMAIGVKTGASGRAMPGSRASGIRKRMDGQVEAWS
jgi:hypothetical protein